MTFNPQPAELAAGCPGMSARFLSHVIRESGIERRIMPMIDAS